MLHCPTCRYPSQAWFNDDINETFNNPSSERVNIPTIYIQWSFSRRQLEDNTSSLAAALIEKVKHKCKFWERGCQHRWNRWISLARRSWRSLNSSLHKINQVPVGGSCEPRGKLPRTNNTLPCAQWLWWGRPTQGGNDLVGWLWKKHWIWKVHFSFLGFSPACGEEPVQRCNKETDQVQPVQRVAKVWNNYKNGFKGERRSFRNNFTPVN